jgi:hypothetical protein
VRTSYNSSPLFVHFMHLSLFYFIIIVIMKVMSQSSHLPWGLIKVIFGILTCCFVQCPLYLLWCTPPSSTFTKSFISFNSSFLQMFGQLLGLGSFDSPKWPLTCKQTSLPITFNGVWFISTSTITPTTYLRNWALVTSIKANRFMVD